MCSFITFKGVLNCPVCHWQRAYVVHSLHVLLLLHGFLEDQVVDHEHDDHGEPERESGGNEGIRDVGDESTVMVACNLSLLEQTGRNKIVTQEKFTSKYCVCFPANKKELCLLTHL